VWKGCGRVEVGGRREGGRREGGGREMYIYKKKSKKIKKQKLNLSY